MKYPHKDLASLRRRQKELIASVADSLINSGRRSKRVRQDSDFFIKEAEQWKQEFESQVMELEQVSVERDMYKSIVDLTIADTLELEESLRGAVFDNDRYSIGKAEGLQKTRRSIERRKNDLGL